MSVELGIVRKSGTGEYKVFWRENGKTNENRAYYTDDKVDAVWSLITMLEKQQEEGRDVRIADSVYTKGLIAKVRPDYLLSAARKYVPSTMSNAKTPFDVSRLPKVGHGWSKIYTVDSARSINIARRSRGGFHVALIPNEDKVDVWMSEVATGEVGPDEGTRFIDLRGIRI